MTFSVTFYIMGKANTNIIMHSSNSMVYRLALMHGNICTGKRVRETCKSFRSKVFNQLIAVQLAGFSSVLEQTLPT